MFSQSSEMFPLLTIAIILMTITFSIISGDGLFKPISRNISNNRNNYNNKRNDPMNTLTTEMQKYIRDCKTDPSSEENEHYGNINTNLKSKNGNKNQFERDDDDDDASFSSRQHYLSRSQKLDQKNKFNYSQQQEHTSAYGRDRNENDHLNQNFLRSRNNDQNRANNCNQNSNNENSNGRHRNYQNNNNRQNNHNNDYENSNRGSRMSDSMARGYSSNQESFMQPSPNRNTDYDYSEQNKYGRGSYYGGGSMYSRNNGDYQNNSNSYRNGGYEDFYSNRNDDYTGQDEYIRGLQPPRQMMWRNDNTRRYPRELGKMSDWKKNQDNIECIARCIFGYLDVLDEDKSPSEVSLIKWLQDHENDSNKRIKALRKVRRCYARLSTSDIEESCEFARSLTSCLEIDLT